MYKRKKNGILKKIKRLKRKNDIKKIKKQNVFVIEKQYF